jgi:hypothetical protein
MSADDRLNRVEAQLIRLKRGLGLACAALGVTLLVAQASPEAAVEQSKLVTTQRLVIVDGGGRKCTELMSDARGTYLLMYREDGGVGAVMSLKGENFGLTSFDAKNESRMLLASNPEGSVLTLWDPKLAAAAAVLASGGISSVRFERKDAEVQPLILAADSRGSTMLQAAGPDEVLRFRLGFENGGTGELETWDKNGNTTARVPKK